MKKLLQVMLTMAIMIQTIKGVNDFNIGDFNICTNVCAGNNLSCKNQSLQCGSTNTTTTSGGGMADALNSFKDTGMKYYDWKDSEKSPRDDLGVIKENKQHKFKFPATGQKKILSFIATEGKLEGKEVEVLFVSFDLFSNRYPKNTPDLIKEEVDAFKEVNQQDTVVYTSQVHVFGRVGSKGKWYHAGSMNFDFQPDSKGFELSFEAKPDGEIVINDHNILNQTGADGTKARISPITLNFGVKN